jgi:hypothetical protein
MRSSLSFLTGDNVSLGTDRIFFSMSLPHLCSIVVGFSTVEGALELGHFVDEDNLELGNFCDDERSEPTGQNWCGRRISWRHSDRVLQPEGSTRNRWLWMLIF